LSVFIPEIETASADQIKSYQDGRLKEMMAYLSENSRYYQDLFKANAIDSNKISKIEDLPGIPTTSKDDLQKHNRDFICVEKRKIIDYITTSGTLGEPVTFAMTDGDLERLAYNEYISFGCAGGTAEDIYQLMVTLDRRFMAGMAYFMGIKKMGAGVIRVGPGNPELQLDTLQKFSPTVFITVPSFLLKLAEFAESRGISYKNSSVKSAVCIGETLRNPDFTLNTLGQKINDKWNLQMHSTYASTEMGTAFTECEHGTGGHHHPEMIIVELLDDEGNPVMEGESGEVTITSLGVEAMPLLRFRTGDICHLHTEPCACGRNTIRLGPVIGRKQQMIKYKGTALYPPALYDILNGIAKVENYIVEVSTNDLGTDEILVRVGCSDTETLEEKEIKDHFRAKLRVAPDVIFQSPQEIHELQFPEMSRKPIFFFDKRQ